ncbi:MAG: hypothetical protein NT055_02120 [Nitrospirae bacterium]|nr:hypothetical protein [Nitrospirota bacterium]
MKIKSFKYLRKSTLFFLFIVLNVAIVVVLLIKSGSILSEHDNLRKDLEEIVRTLHLTDMVLSTDARYTRHPTQTDLFSAFQDYPGSIEHFPTGSVIAPPDFTSIGTFIKVHKFQRSATTGEHR